MTGIVIDFYYTRNLGCSMELMYDVILSLLRIKENFRCKTNIIASTKFIKIWICINFHGLIIIFDLSKFFKFLHLL